MEKRVSVADSCQFTHVPQNNYLDLIQSLISIKGHFTNGTKSYAFNRKNLSLPRCICDPTIKLTCVNNFRRWQKKMSLSAC